jgi:CelD/BcsL family acetyltransferase involved in cellulose biosynthesis
MADALREMADGLALDGALRMWRLALDGRAIAVMFAVVEQDTAWLGKIAFDETFAAYSPGVLLVLDAIAAPWPAIP